MQMYVNIKVCDSQKSACDENIRKKSLWSRDFSQFSKYRFVGNDYGFDF